MSLGRNTVLLLSLVLVAKIVSYSWQNSHVGLHSSFSKRDTTELPIARECDQILLQEDQCAYAIEHCMGITPGLINYIPLYYCASTAVKPIVFIALCAWLLFLFGFVGIAASDFFCPNLQTIASVMNLSESLTGVTFLALGNGSPDLFSTFSAMKSNMGSLALGELIGAASFIVSVIAGSMCAIKPFRAKRLSFLRDVSFFTIAIILVMSIVADGLIHLYEAVILIVFYVVYVFVVVGGNYYMKRRSTYMNLIQRARLEYEETGAEVDNLLRGNTWDEPEASEDEMELYDEGFETEGFHSDYNGHRNATHPKLRIRTSLFSAIEFQDVVHSLQSANARYYNIHGRNRHNRQTSSNTLETNLNNVPLSTRSQPQENGQTNDAESDTHSMDTSSGQSMLQSLPGRFKKIRLLIPDNVLGIDFHDIGFHLFPSLQNFEQKSIFNKASSIVSAPVIFLLAITLPVVRESLVKKSGGVVLDEDAMTMLEDVAEEDQDPMDITDLHESTSKWSQWLTATQLICAPLFVAIVFAINKVVHPAIILPIGAGIGVGTSIIFRLTTSSVRQPRLYWMMCFIGFGIAVVWIFVIANEVVSVLQTIGMAVGVSDAILGLTVFALGNSLGDFVANITMAKLGYPMMAMSACFGGPMLNIMLGVGIGATYVTSKHGVPYSIEVSSTILVSAIGLLVVLISSLILVPLNGYRMSRVFGYSWITIYLICTVINLVLEIRG
ncbi:Sodium/calcium exchanger protein-domain-containing protein [Phycomyces nitens]|nr:Sodium/calcium exchanger protein-domain-containing protein [Phycomyces nitens]